MKFYENEKNVHLIIFLFTRHIADDNRLYFRFIYLEIE